jgi:guanosine-3',5'-bis(diphosphate) 3'-pyrophosphohydrolase
MMRQYELVERVTSYKPDADENLLNKAYVYAMQKHGSQFRANGDPYFSHPLEVAAILTDLKLDEATIAVALLHDTIEDTDATRKEIDGLFGEDIGALVEGLTKLKRIDLVSNKAKQGENLRRLLLAVADDVRVLLVKLADRLHNMRTLHFVPEHKRARISQETMDIYAPLAGRMGIQDIRDELEHLSFKHLNPTAFKTVSTHLEELRAKNLDLIASIEQELLSKLSDHQIEAKVSSREKRPYSVFRKMERRGLSFEQLSDIFGFRIIVETTEDCYRALGIVHTSWPTVPGRFKDYISTPKQNGYRSIHTTVVGPSKQRVELQIRTAEMNKVADFGIAAHTLYKDAINGDATGKEPTKDADGGVYGWLRNTIALLAEGESPDDFLEHTKLELFLDQVFCFTPKGRLIALPRGATPIDFAYAVHTDVGDSCVGCKINGRIMPVVTELFNGDEVEIIRAEGQVPPAAWESVVVTGKARAAVRRATKKAVQEQYCGLGKSILERAFERAGKTFDDQALSHGLHRLARKSNEEVLAAVGRGELTSSDVVKAVFPDYQDERVTKPVSSSASDGWFGLKGAAGIIFKVPGRKKTKGRKTSSPIPIRGHSKNLPVQFAPNGGAVPGDRIVGILTPGKGITIYPIHSRALQAFEEKSNEWLDVRWDIDENNIDRFPSTIMVTAINEPGTLAKIAELVARNDGNIHSLEMITTAHDFTKMQIDLEVWGLKHLNRLIREIRALKIVSRVERVNG